jgi:hypothetical protein
MGEREREREGERREESNKHRGRERKMDGEEQTLRLFAVSGSMMERIMMDSIAARPAEITHNETRSKRVIEERRNEHRKTYRCMHAYIQTYRQTDRQTDTKTHTHL